MAFCHGDKRISCHGGGRGLLTGSTSGRHLVHPRTSLLGQARKPVFIPAPPTAHVLVSLSHVKLHLKTFVGLAVKTHGSDFHGSRLPRVMLHLGHLRTESTCVLRSGAVGAGSVSDEHACPRCEAGFLCFVGSHTSPSILDTFY